MTCVPVTETAAVSAVAKGNDPITVSADPGAVGGWQVMCGDVVVQKGFGSHASADEAAEEYASWRTALAK